MRAGQPQGLAVPYEPQSGQVGATGTEGGYTAGSLPHKEGVALLRKSWRYVGSGVALSLVFSSGAVAGVWVLSGQEPHRAGESGHLSWLSPVQTGFAHLPARSTPTPAAAKSDATDQHNGGSPQLQDLNLVAPWVEKVDGLRGLTTRSACKAVLNFGTVLDGQRLRRL